MSFKKNFEEICLEKGVSPSKACRDNGFHASSYSAWTEDTVPRNSTLIKFARYFGVPVDYLLGNTEETKKPTVTEDDGLVEYLEELRSRPEMRMLFSLAKGATKEDVERAVAIIEALRRTSNG